jgi:hypothetical protein
VKLFPGRADLGLDGGQVLGGDLDLFAAVALAQGRDGPADVAGIVDGELPVAGLVIGRVGVVLLVGGLGDERFLDGLGGCREGNALSFLPLRPLLGLGRQDRVGRLGPLDTLGVGLAVLDVLGALLRGPGQWTPPWRECRLAGKECPILGPFVIVRDRKGPGLIAPVNRRLAAGSR